MQKFIGNKYVINSKYLNKIVENKLFKFDN